MYVYVFLYSLMSFKKPTADASDKGEKNAQEDPLTMGNKPFDNVDATDMANDSKYVDFFDHQRQKSKAFSHSTTKPVTYNTAVSNDDSNVVSRDGRADPDVAQRKKRSKSISLGTITNPFRKLSISSTSKAKDREINREFQTGDATLTAQPNPTPAGTGAPVVNPKNETVFFGKFVDRGRPAPAAAAAPSQVSPEKRKNSRVAYAGTVDPLDITLNRPLANTHLDKNIAISNDSDTSGPAIGTTGTTSNGAADSRQSKKVSIPKDVSPMEDRGRKHSNTRSTSNDVSPRSTNSSSKTQKRVSFSDTSNTIQPDKNQANIDVNNLDKEKVENSYEAEMKRRKSSSIEEVYNTTVAYDEYNRNDNIPLGTIAGTVGNDKSLIDEFNKTVSETDSPIINTAKAYNNASSRSSNSHSKSFDPGMERKDNSNVTNMLRENERDQKKKGNENKQIYKRKQVTIHSPKKNSYVEKHDINRSPDYKDSSLDKKVDKMDIRNIGTPTSGKYVITPNQKTFVNDMTPSSTKKTVLGTEGSNDIKSSTLKNTVPKKKILQDEPPTRSKERASNKKATVNELPQGTNLMDSSASQPKTKDMVNELPQGTNLMDSSATKPKGKVMIEDLPRMDEYDSHHRSVGTSQPKTKASVNELPQGTNLMDSSATKPKGKVMIEDLPRMDEYDSHHRSVGASQPKTKDMVNELPQGTNLMDSSATKPKGKVMIEDLPRMDEYDSHHRSVGANQPKTKASVNELPQGTNLMDSSATKPKGKVMIEDLPRMDEYDSHHRSVGASQPKTKDMVNELPQGTNLMDSSATKPKGKVMIEDLPRMDEYDSHHRSVGANQPKTKASVNELPQGTNLMDSSATKPKGKVMIEDLPRMDEYDSHHRSVGASQPKTKDMVNELPQGTNLMDSSATKPKGKVMIEDLPRMDEYDSHHRSVGTSQPKTKASVNELPQGTNLMDSSATKPKGKVMIEDLPRMDEYDSHHRSVGANQPKTKASVNELPQGTNLMDSSATKPKGKVMIEDLPRMDEYDSHHRSVGANQPKTKASVNELPQGTNLMDSSATKPKGKVMLDELPRSPMINHYTKERKTDSLDPKVHTLSGDFSTKEPVLSPEIRDIEHIGAVGQSNGGSYQMHGITGSTRPHEKYQQKSVNATKDMNITEPNDKADKRFVDHEMGRNSMGHDSGNMNPITSLNISEPKSKDSERYVKQEMERSKQGNTKPSNHHAVGSMNIVEPEHYPEKQSAGKDHSSKKQTPISFLAGSSDFTADPSVSSRRSLKSEDIDDLDYIKTSRHGNKHGQYDNDNNDVDDLKYHNSLVDPSVPTYGAVKDENKPEDHLIHGTPMNYSYKSKKKTKRSNLQQSTPRAARSTKPAKNVTKSRTNDPSIIKT
ncbi:hypothetical protein RNJ44_02341 [Nakaseomyces bracarensis]|uniref:Uncharacterized protein n=1 Tax=Nakaseomyces bracarensis TaxID=273131 RepID=A0ABR4NNE4_9SACH